MSLQVDWITKEIYVPQSYLTLVSGSNYNLDVNQFRLDLKLLEEGQGMPFDTTHNHNTEVTVGGVTLARVVEIINGYTVTFEDGLYAVTLIGANNNILDVTNINQVSLRSTNSAGLATVTSKDIASAVWDVDHSLHQKEGTTGETLQKAKVNASNAFAVAASKA